MGYAVDAQDKLAKSGVGLFDAVVEGDVTVTAQGGEVDAFFGKFWVQFLILDEARERCWKSLREFFYYRDLSQFRKKKKSGK